MTQAPLPAPGINTIPALSPAQIHDQLDRIWQWLILASERAKLAGSATMVFQRADIESVGYTILQAVALLEGTTAAGSTPAAPAAPTAPAAQPAAQQSTPLDLATIQGMFTQLQQQVEASVQQMLDQTLQKVQVAAPAASAVPAPGK